MRRACVLLGVVVALVLGPGAQAQSPHEGVTFTASFTDPGDHFSPGGVDAACPVGKVVIRGTAYFRGPLRGMDTAVGCLSWDPVAQLDALQSADGPGFTFAGSTDDHIVGSLDGCGEGSFTARQTDLKITSFDPVAHTFHLTLKWVVAPGSGTGAFRGAFGGGTGYADGTGGVDAAAAPPTTPFISPNAGMYVGTITCPHHD